MSRGRLDRSWIGALALLFASLCATVATAAPLDQDPDVEVARRHFDRGTKFYADGEYQQALDEFEAARRVKPLPAFDYNIGRCYDRLERYPEAIEAYRRFVAVEKDPAQVADTRARIAVLEQRLPPSSPPPATETPPPAVAAPPQATVTAPPVTQQPPPEPRRPIALPVTFAVAAVAVAIAGTALVASVAPDYDTLKMQWEGPGGHTAALQSRANDLETRATVGYVLWGVAGAIAIVDAVLWIVRARSGATDGDKPRTIAFSPLGLGGRF